MFLATNLDLHSREGVAADDGRAGEAPDPEGDHRRQEEIAPRPVAEAG
jgi:hypothetical protein